MVLATTLGSCSDRTTLHDLLQETDGPLPPLRAVQIAVAVCDGGNTDLHALGRAYGVIKLVSDPPHWSSDGR